MKVEAEYTNYIYHDYKVLVFIQGGPSRPCYEGFVKVVAIDAEQAADKAIKKLSTGSFMDVSPTNMKVKSVERIL